MEACDDLSTWRLDLSSAIRAELDVFQGPLLVEMERVFVRVLSLQTSSNTMQGGLAGDRGPCDGMMVPYSSGCSSPVDYSPANGCPMFPPVKDETNHDGEYLDVLAEAEEEAKELAEELEHANDHHQYDAKFIKKLREGKPDDSFASTFMSSVADSDDNLVKPHYHVEERFHEYGTVVEIARSPRFKNFYLFLVFANAIYIGVEMDLRVKVTTGESDGMSWYDADWAFIVAENLFCGFFLLEIVVRGLAFRNKIDCLRDGWFRFDAVLAILAVFESWILAPLVAGGAAIVLPLGPVRLLRCLRMTRMTRLVSAIPELMTMTRGMYLASRAVLSSLLMICFLNYCFAVMLQLLLSEDDEVNEIVFGNSKRDFESVPACMWLLFMDGTLQASGDMVLTELMRRAGLEHVVGCVVFIVYMLLSSLVIMNMLIGCLCEVVSSVTLQHNEEEAIRLMKQSILLDLKQFDNGDGMLTRKELDSVLKSSQSKAILRSLSIDELFLKELKSMLFVHEDSQVSIQAVMQLMLQCRGDLAVTVLHLARGQAFVSTLIASFEKKMMAMLSGARPSVMMMPTNTQRANEGGDAMTKDPQLPEPKDPHLSGVLSDNDTRVLPEEALMQETTGGLSL